MKPRWTFWGIVTVLAVAPALAEELDWFTVDGGGAMMSAGNGFDVSGTAGQPDAGYMAGGQFEINGGFWVAAVPTCACLADLNKDSLLNGLDVQGFVECLVATGTNCTCADVDGIPGLDVGDVDVFVNGLIVGATCP